MILFVHYSDLGGWCLGQKIKAIIISECHRLKLYNKKNITLYIYIYIYIYYLHNYSHLYITLLKKINTHFSFVLLKLKMAVLKNNDILFQR